MSLKDYLSGARLFSNLVTNGVTTIYEEDLETQEHYILTVLNMIRGRTLDKVPDVYWKAKCFFVPNDKYIKHYFGKACFNPNFDLYYDFETCLWNNYLVFPVMDLSSKVVGLYGFNPVVKATNNAEGGKDPTYLYSNRSLFKRSDHLYTLPYVWDKAFEEDTIFITDGLFDTMSCLEHGITAACVMGSILSEKLVAILGLFKHVYLLMDNDAAGESLLREGKRKIPGFCGIKQNKFKDADDAIKLDSSGEYISTLLEVAQAKPKHDVLIRL